MQEETGNRLTVIEAIRGIDGTLTRVEAWATLAVDGGFRFMRFKIILKGKPRIAFGDLIEIASKRFVWIYRDEADSGRMARIIGDVWETVEP